MSASEMHKHRIAKLIFRRWNAGAPLLSRRRKLAYSIRTAQYNISLMKNMFDLYYEYFREFRGSGSMGISENIFIIGFR